MERNIQKNGLVNLVAVAMVFLAAFVVTSYVHSLAGQVGSIFLGLGVLVAFASWFQMRLEENERLERLEVEEIARSRGESTLFEAKDADIFPAQRARAVRKIFGPGFWRAALPAGSRGGLAALALDFRPRRRPRP